jgi:hypothetical protein
MLEIATVGRDVQVGLYHTMPNKTIGVFPVTMKYKMG